MDKGNTLWGSGYVHNTSCTFFSKLFSAVSCVKLVMVSGKPPVNGQLFFKKKKKKSLIQPSVLKGKTQEV